MKSSKSHKPKRLLSLLLTLCMALALMPTVAFAVPAKPVITDVRALPAADGWQKFTVVASGEDLEYQWQIGYENWNRKGWTWLSVEEGPYNYFGAQTDTFVLYDVDWGSDFHVRCQVSNAGGKDISQKIIMRGAHNATLAQNVTVNGLTMPVEFGAQCLTASTSANDHYTVESVTWALKNKVGILYYFKGDFMLGMEYNVEVVLKVNDGYYFNPNNFSATISGKPARVQHSATEAQDYWSEGKVRLMLVDNVTAEPLTPIEIIEVNGVVQPVAGMPANNYHTVPPGVNYRATRLDWYEVVTPWDYERATIFESGKMYTVHIYLVANSGYKFVPYWSQISINGEQAAGYVTTSPHGQIDPTGKNGDFYIYGTFICD